MSREELINCYYADILDCNADNLVDLKRVDIAADRPVQTRMEQYLNQVKNPYLFRVDKLMVKVSFSGNRDLSSVLVDLLAQS